MSSRDIYERGFDESTGETINSESSRSSAERMSSAVFEEGTDGIV